MYDKIDFLSTTTPSTIKLSLRMMGQTKNKSLAQSRETHTRIRRSGTKSLWQLDGQKDNWPKPSNLDWTVENTTFQLIHTVSRNTPFVKLVVVGRNAVPRDMCGYGVWYPLESTHVGLNRYNRDNKDRCRRSRMGKEGPIHSISSSSSASRSRLIITCEPEPIRNSTQLNRKAATSLLRAPCPNTPEKKYLWASPLLYIPTIRRFHRLINLTPQSLALK